MATEHSQQRDFMTPLREGEFQRIPGIGPGIAQRLHAAGIQTFSHLASLTPEEIYAQLTGLVGMTAERIAHQDWPGRAGFLASELAVAEPAAEEPHPEPEETAERQHYASFMVELLQDENHVVRRTRVVHVQNSEKDTWAGWDALRMARWITTQANVAVTATPTAEPVTSSTTPTPAPPARPVTEPPAVRIKPPAAAPSVPLRVSAFELTPGEIVAAGSDRPGQFLNAGQPFAVHLSLEARGKTGLVYHAVVHARSPGGPRLQVAEACGPCAADDVTRLAIPVESLAEGAYRLETTLLVYPEGAANPEKEGRIAFADSGMVYVYAPETEAAV